MRDCIRRVYLSLWPGALTGLESAVCLERDTLRSRHLTFVFLSKSDNNARFFLVLRSPLSLSSKKSILPLAWAWLVAAVSGTHLPWTIFLAYASKIPHSAYVRRIL